MNAIRSNWRRVLAAVFTTALLGASLPTHASDIADREYDRAVKSFRAGRTSEAWGQFQELASRGDVDSARIALFMLNYGPALYGKQWDALPGQVEYWAQLVRNSGTSARPLPVFEPQVVSRKGAPRAAAVRGISLSAR
ncbi:hypothetical protein HHL11_25760 [Ramlibacter sp. G-1-2-2]|uniref:Sel1 repeat family protein n=1 Tax=Ramlibacter agri TaxID=2728837 RepID=A0A848HCG8_9BURK|nr:hypothetical protein [Ramlibacter agri]NML47179.1 hypothetical protein [Ramlibacter agri]